MPINVPCQMMSMKSVSCDVIWQTFKRKATYVERVSSDVRYGVVCMMCSEARAHNFKVGSKVMMSSKNGGNGGYIPSLMEENNVYMAPVIVDYRQPRFVPNRWDLFQQMQKMKRCPHCNAKKCEALSALLYAYIVKVSNGTTENLPGVVWKRFFDQKMEIMKKQWDSGDYVGTGLRTIIYPVCVHAKFREMFGEEHWPEVQIEELTMYGDSVENLCLHYRYITEDNA